MQQEGVVYFFLYPVGHFGFTPVIFRSFPSVLTQVIVALVGDGLGFGFGFVLTVGFFVGTGDGFTVATGFGLISKESKNSLAL